MESWQIDEKNGEAGEKTGREVEVIRNSNKKLKIKLELQEQYGKKNDVIICGIEDDPNESEEDVMKKVIEVSRKLKSKLKSLEIFASHRDYQREKIPRL